MPLRTVYIVRGKKQGGVCLSLVGEEDATPFADKMMDLVVWMPSVT